MKQTLDLLTSLSYGQTAFLMRCAQTLVDSTRNVAAAVVEASNGCWEDAGQRWQQLANGDGEKRGLTGPDALVSAWRHAVQDTTTRVQEATRKISVIGAQTQLQLSQVMTDHLSLVAGATGNLAGTMTSDAGAAVALETASTKAA
jgi:hypothetical protein